MIELKILAIIGAAAWLLSVIIKAIEKINAERKQGKIT